MRAKLTKRKLWLAGTGVTAVAAALVVPLTSVNAAPMMVTATATTYGDVGNDWQGRYQTIPVSTPDGAYNVSTNLWNPAVLGSFDFHYDTEATRFTVSNYNANSYYGTGVDPTDPECADDGLSSDPFDPTCDWVGVGDPWLNPITGNQDQWGYRDNAGGYPEWLEYTLNPQGEPHLVPRESEFGKQIHAPAAYPSIIAGCHWGSCTAGGNGTGAPFPLQASGISRMESIWTIDVPDTVSENEAWNASYDIWYDTNTRWVNANTREPVLPHRPDLLNSPGQNDGAEIMIWVNNAGYNNAQPGDTPQTYQPGIIQPAGVLLQADVAIEGVQTLINGVPQPVRFDVWGARARSFDNGIRWNVISFVARQKGEGLVTPGAPWGGFDAHAFARYAASLDEQGKVCATADPVGIVRQTIQTPDGKIHWISTPEERTCLELTWWMTSVQAGFEIWNLPQDKTLSTTRFMVNPVAVSGGVNTGGRATDGGVPLVNWNDTFNLQAGGCANGTASWSIDAQNYAPWTSPPDFTPVGGHVAIGNPVGFTPNPNPAGVVPVTIESAPMVESPAGTGNYIATGVGPLWNNPAYILHGPATVTIAIACPDGQTYTTQSSLYIDPSGRVMNTNGDPIEGATVTLYRANTQNGIYTPVPNGSPIMSPDNRTNPDLTDANGHYRWDVQPGWYKVRAQKDGCTRPGSDVAFVESPAKQVAANLPPVTDLNLILSCGEELRSPFDVQVRRTTAWNSDSGGGYCADIIVTNLSGNPLEWVVEVALAGNIYTKWNFESTHLNGNVYRIRGVEWNRTLAPGASTHSVGYCANN